MIIIGGAYIAFTGAGSVVDCLSDAWKYGYWFMLSLFEFVVLQALIEALTHAMSLCHESVGYVCIESGLALALFILSLPTVRELFGSLNGVVGMQQLRYFIYFAAGRIISIHIISIAQAHWSRWAMATTVVLFFVLAVDTWGISHSSYIGITFWIRLVAFEMSAVLTVFAVFRRHERWFSSSSKLAHAITFIGRHTLEIYLLHFFFLASDMSVIGIYFAEHPAPVAEMIVTGILTLAVVTLSLAVGEMLRASSLLGKYVLGGR